MYSNVAAYCCKICGAPPSESFRLFDARPIRDAGRNAVEERSGNALPFFWRHFTELDEDMMQRNRSCRSAARCQDQCCLHAPYLGCHEPTAALPGFVGDVVREVVLR